MKSYVKAINCLSARGIVCTNEYYVGVLQGLPICNLTQHKNCRKHVKIDNDKPNILEWKDDEKNNKDCILETT